MVAADWLQGPYVYDLYASYGFSQHEIAVLFVAGFGSSFFLGTYIGSLADQFGRKKWALLYVVLYCSSCFTKHFPNFWMLMLGRIFGGIATSLLFSVFDSWMVKEHHERGFPSEWLSETFSSAMFGNSVAAILCGMAAQQAADFFPLAPLFNHMTMWGGSCTPFDMSIVCLLVGGMYVMGTWSENYGGSTHESRDPHGGGFSLQAVTAAIKTVMTNRDVLFTGLIQSLFEGSMYTFVFMWTPALTDPTSDTKPPYGLIFATFMVACMAGSSLFSLIHSRTDPSAVIYIPLSVSALALSVPIFTSNPNIVVIGFLVFEVCVGIYFPAISTLKGEIVPEQGRAAIYNLFRVPLNAIVLCVLLTDLSVPNAMASCVVMLLVATGLALSLHSNLLKGSQSLKRDMGDESGLL